MTALAAVHDQRRLSAAARVGLLLCGLAGAVVMRQAINGDSVGSALEAGVAFAATLVPFALLADRRLVLGLPAPASLLVGLVGGVAIVAVPLLIHPFARPVGLRPEPFAAWALVTCAVAVAEETLLRGALFNAIESAAGVWPAILISSIAFALMHVPFYGWSVVPIDLGAGLVLCGLRLITNGVSAPAIAHALADLATWWL